MLKQRYRLVAFSLFLLDEAVTFVSFLAAHLVRDRLLTAPLGRPVYPLGDYLFLLPVIFVAWGLSFWFLGLYRSHRTVTFARETWELTRAVAAGGLVLGLFIFLSRTGVVVSRLLVLGFLAINLAALVLERAAVRSLGRRLRQRGYNFRNIVIVGVGPEAAAFADTVRHHPYWGINVLGHVDPDGEAEPGVSRAAVLGGVRQLPDIIRDQVVDEVIFVVPNPLLSTLEEIFLLCEEQGIRTRVVMQYLPRQMAKVYVELVDGVPVMTFTTAPIDATALAVKRLLDVVLSLLLLALASPLMLGAALAVKLTSPGPVLFRQTRVGLNGRRFTLLKFRSMYRDAEQRRAEVEHLNELDGPVFKARHDPRITPVGRFLRAFSLDELPQLWNVLKGDMSFVGPRPPIPSEVTQYQRWQRRRLSMKPGLTGLWQVSGRGAVDFDTWMRMDLDYIDRWSLWLDVRIILKTIPSVLSRRGAM